jgi:bifunctional non-homologous end joining protein LigD
MNADVLLFVVQKHAARQLHYDFRLEVNGVLKSWAVPKGPSLNLGEARLAIQVEDHPLDYASFEGVIPEGSYGAGRVIVWDTGTYSLDEGRTDEGKLSLTLYGHKLKGSWTLVHSNRRPTHWLLTRRSGDEESVDERSVLSGLTLDDLKERP